MKVVLIGNYANDNFRSMRFFADMLAVGIRERGVECRVLMPRSFLGGLRPGSTGVGKWLGYVDKFLLFPRVLRREVRLAGTDPVVFHICDHSNAMYTRYLEDVPHVVTCHDVLGIRSGLGLEPLNPRGRTGKIFQGCILHGLRRAHHVACVSPHTKRQLAELGVRHSAMSVVWNGLNYPYRPMPAEAARRVAEQIARAAGNQLGEAGFLLHLSGPGWYKNRLGVVMAYAELLRLWPEAPLLFLAGKPPTQEVMDVIAHRGIASSVVICPNRTTEELNALYSAAEVLFFPSHAEGFGWPIIEAQACGCPVLTSDRPPMNEVGAEAALYLDPPPADRSALPDWAVAAARQLHATLRMDVARREEVIAAGLRNAERFSTGEMMDHYFRCYDSLLARNLDCR